MNEHVRLRRSYWYGSDRRLSAEDRAQSKQYDPAPRPAKSSIGFCPVRAPTCGWFVKGRLPQQQIFENVFPVATKKRPLRGGLSLVLFHLPPVAGEKTWITTEHHWCGHVPRLGLWQPDLDRLFVVCASMVKFAPGFKSFAATIVSCRVPRI